MFKFGFGQEGDVEEKADNEENEKIDWIPASKLIVSSLQIEKLYEPSDYSEHLFWDCKLKLIRSEKALKDLTKEQSKFILEAESQHSDLIPAKYEGGLKIWECTYDLSQFISEQNIQFQDKVILDLGCGAGVLGLIALAKGAIVHFQDYNAEVLNAVTVPNVMLNVTDKEDALKKCEFYSGDWESFSKLSDTSCESAPTKYDLIFTSETIYNPENHTKLYEVFKRRLKENGLGFIAGKSYYFGVGGSMKQFTSLIEKDGFFDSEIVWSIQQGLQRDILKISRKQQ